MYVRIITLRYSDGLQGFPEDAVREATMGRELLEVREHFFVHGNVPHLTLVLLLSDEAAGTGRMTSKARPDPGQDLPEHLRPLYRDLRAWRNERAKSEGIPSYVVFRNAQLAEICRRLPRSLSELRGIEGVGEATCRKYGKDVLAVIPADMAPVADEQVERKDEGQ